MANSPTPFTLRQIIIADAATCLAMGALLVIAPRVIAVLTQIPESLLFYAGVGLFPIAFFMAIVGLRFPTSAPGASLVIIGNILWVIASVSLLFVLKSLNAIADRCRVVANLLNVDDDLADCLPAHEAIVRFGDIFESELRRIEQWPQSAGINDLGQLRKYRSMGFSFVVVQHRDQHEYDV